VLITVKTLAIVSNVKTGCISTVDLLSKVNKSKVEHAIGENYGILNVAFG
jgi:hypothetical protein